MVSTFFGSAYYFAQYVLGDEGTVCLLFYRKQDIIFEKDVMALLLELYGREQSVTENIKMVGNAMI